jgi:LmbE family N-acetylglucosaminyl deacetylase
VTPAWAERILVVAPHADDETLGCGGLLTEYAGSARRVVIMSLGKTPTSPGEQTFAELREAMRRLQVDDFRVVFTGAQGRLDARPQADLVGALDASIDDFRPTSLFVPYASHHQDHRAVYQATLAALRPRPSTLGIRLVALYEYPYAASWPPPDLPAGKFHLKLHSVSLRRKLSALAAYKTQVGRPGTWLDVKRAELWARMRGAEVGVTAAEAFWLLRGWL